MLSSFLFSGFKRNCPGLHHLLPPTLMGFMTRIVQSILRENCHPPRPITPPAPPAGRNFMAGKVNVQALGLVLLPVFVELKARAKSRVRSKASHTVQSVIVENIELVLCLKCNGCFCECLYLPALLVRRDIG